MQIRFARWQDMERVREIMESVITPLHIYPEQSRRDTLETYSLRTLRQIITSDPHCIMVGEDDDGIAGCSVTRVDRGTLFIDWICVDPAMRSKRLGPQLYDFTFALGRTLGLSKSWGASVAGNRSVQRFLPIIGAREICVVKNHWYGTDWLLWEYVYADEPENRKRLLTL